MKTIKARDIKVGMTIARHPDWEVSKVDIASPTGNVMVNLSNDYFHNMCLTLKPNINVLVK